MRLISLCPSNTEKLAYLGLTDSLVGVDDYSDWPETIKDLPRLGPDLKINMDRVEALNPDLVVASLSVPGMERNIAKLEERNIPHVVYNPYSLEEIGQCLHDLAKRTGTSDEAMNVVNNYHSLLNDYKQRAQGLTRKRLYWEWWPKPVFTPGGTNWLTEISELAGGENVFADQKIPSVKTDWDEVLTRDPDHICLAWVGIASDKVKPALLQKRPKWAELKAMKQGNIHILEEPLYCRPSPRLLLGLKKLAALLHPTVFPADDGLDPLFNQKFS